MHCIVAQSNRSNKVGLKESDERHVFLSDSLRFHESRHTAVRDLCTYMTFMGRADLNSAELNC